MNKIYFFTNSAAREITFAARFQKQKTLTRDDCGDFKMLWLIQLCFMAIYNSIYVHDMLVNSIVFLSLYYGPPDIVL